MIAMGDARGVIGGVSAIETETEAAVVAVRAGVGVAAGVRVAAVVWGGAGMELGCVSVCASLRVNGELNDAERVWMRRPRL
jgi:hypothetical protein